MAATTVSSAGGLLAMLNEPHPSLKLHALSNLNAFVDYFWPEISTSVPIIVSCMVAAENNIRAPAVVCLGYPLKGTNGAIQDEPLVQPTVPTMFVEGSEDVLCLLELLEPIRKRMKALNRLHVIENGDHSFQIAKKNFELAGLSREEAKGRSVEAIAMFVSQIIRER